MLVTLSRIEQRYRFIRLQMDSMERGNLFNEKDGHFSMAVFSGMCMAML